MRNEDHKESKREILDKIFLKEEDTLKQLDEIVELAKNHFKVEFDTGDIVFLSDKPYSIKEKILLLLISRYLVKAGGRTENTGLDINEISSILSIKNTSLSKPLGILKSEGVIKKDEDGRYSVIYHQIKKVLLEIQK